MTDPKLKGLQEQLERAKERAKDSNPDTRDRRRAHDDIDKLQGMIKRAKKPKQ